MGKSRPVLFAMADLLSLFLRINPDDDQSSPPRKSMVLMLTVLGLLYIPIVSLGMVKHEIKCLNA